MKFERGGSIRKNLSIGKEGNHVLITKISRYQFSHSAVGQNDTKIILGDLSNPAYRDYYVFYKVPNQEEQGVPAYYEMKTQVKFLPNSKGPIWMLYEGEYYDVPTK